MKNPDIVPWNFTVSALVAGLLIMPTYCEKHDGPNQEVSHTLSSQKGFSRPGDARAEP
jgi:hypothetical protein